MPTITARDYQQAADIERLIEFVWAARPRPFVAEFPGVHDLAEVLSVPANRDTLRIWFNEEDQVVGFAFVDGFHTLRFDVQWQTPIVVLEHEIITWAEGCVRALHPFLYATSPEADHQRLACLARLGFIQRPDSIVHMMCSLPTAIPEPSIPTGFAIRPVAGEVEAAAIAALHRTAFGTEHMTTERRLRMMRTATYDPALDLVAVAPDGTLAAYALGQGGQAQQEGESYADLFATHPQYRGRGLAQTLMQVIVKRLQVKGYTAARLSTDSDNLAMQRVASAVGFFHAATTLRFQRAVAAYGDVHT